MSQLVHSGKTSIGHTSDLVNFILYLLLRLKVGVAILTPTSIASFQYWYSVEMAVLSNLSRHDLRGKTAQVCHSKVAMMKHIG